MGQSHGTSQLTRFLLLPARNILAGVFWTQIINYQTSDTYG